MKIIKIEFRGYILIFQNLAKVFNIMENRLGYKWGLVKTLVLY